MSDQNDKFLVPVGDIPITMNTLALLATTPAVPERYKGNVNDMLAAVLYGRSLGIDPIIAINELFLVDGKVSMTGKQMSDLVHRRGHQLRLRISAKESVVEAWRRDPWSHQLDMVGEFKFTDADAKKAGLSQKVAWVNYPDMMRTWRAITWACRTVFADCLGGAGYIPEEFDVEGYDVEPIPVDDIDMEIDDEIIGEVELEQSIMEVAEVMAIESVGPVRHE